jgi:hypothetical protein
MLRTEYETITGEEDPITQYRSLRIKIGITDQNLNKKENAYREIEAQVKTFETEKGMSIPKLQKFIKENQFLIADKKLLENEVRLYENIQVAHYKGRQESELWYYCNVCRRPIVIYPNSEVHRLIVQFLFEKGWGHSTCHYLYR